MVTSGDLKKFEFLIIEPKLIVFDELAKGMNK